MTVRLAEKRDRMRVVRMLRDAHGAAGLPFDFSAPHALALVDQHMASEKHLAVVLVAAERAVGVLMASAQAHPFAPVLYAAETVWWVDPDHRGTGVSAMLKTYEEWARSLGCSFCNMVALDAAPRAGVIYRRQGYQAAETHYLKPLN